MAANELFAQLHEAAQTPRKQLDKYLAEGRKVVAVAPVYTPQEIIHSMGLVPMGAWGADMEIKRDSLCSNDVSAEPETCVWCEIYQGRISESDP